MRLDTSGHRCLPFSMLGMDFQILFLNLDSDNMLPRLKATQNEIHTEFAATAACGAAASVAPIV